MAHNYNILKSLMCLILVSIFFSQIIPSYSKSMRKNRRQIHGERNPCPQIFDYEEVGNNLWKGLISIDKPPGYEPAIIEVTTMSYGTEATDTTLDLMFLGDENNILTWEFDIPVGNDDWMLISIRVNDYEVCDNDVDHDYLGAMNIPRVYHTSQSEAVKRNRNLRILTKNKDRRRKSMKAKLKKRKAQNKYNEYDRDLY
ncbi:uncharacterized protein [Onthophagus taurus]|uniref:uncharacterized protein n=1 Tax=Onthophagus taurus TaxID=166361 RepID=UPI0039BEB5A8